MSEYKRPYMKVNGDHTHSVEEYIESWEAITKPLEGIFDGYVLAAMNPTIVLEKRQINKEENTYRVLDRVELSVEAAKVLIAKFEGR